MTWANLAILGLGGLLLLVPIVLHFLMQPKPKDIVFPALRFLKARQQSNKSSMRIRHFLLLMMRCLLIGLVALALAGPSVASADFGNWLTLGGIGISGLLVGIIALLAWLRPSKNWLLIGILAAIFLGHLIYGAISASRLLNSESAQLLGDDQAPVAALIVFDTSPRMDYKTQNQTRLQAGKEIGTWLISQLPADSQVCVLPTSNDRPFFSVDVAAAQRRLETLEINFSGVSVPGALLDGLQILNKAPQERKEIYLITDLTRQSWGDENPNALLKQLDKEPNTNLFVLDVGVVDTSNFSLTELQLSDVEISQSSHLSIKTQVQRQGSAGQRAIRMSIEKPDPPLPVVRNGQSVFPEKYFDGQVVNKDIRQDGSADLKFTFSQPLVKGTYHGKVKIEGEDGLAIDDERFFTIRVGDTKRALVVHPEDVNPRIMESLLAPRDKIEAGTAKYEYEVIPQSNFTGLADWSQYDAIFLLNPLPIQESDWSRLEAFVNGGGGLGIFLGHNAADGPLAHESFTTPTAQRVLTGALEQQWYTEESDVFLSPKELTHPVFELVRTNETAVLWNRFPVFLHWGIEPDQASEELPTQTLLRYNNREPAVIQRTIGAGRVLVMTTPITEYGFVENRISWNALLTGKAEPAFMLLNGMTSFLLHRDVGSLNIVVGQSVSFSNDPREYPETYQVFSPVAQKPPSKLNSDGKLRYRFTNAPGHYRLKGVFNEQVVLRGFSANLELAATDLTRIDPDKLDSFLGHERYQLAQEKGEIVRQQGATRRGMEFYPLLMLMMMVVLAVEYLMSNRFYKG